MRLPFFQYLKGSKYERNASICLFLIGISFATATFTSFIYTPKSTTTDFKDFSKKFSIDTNKPIAEVHFRGEEEIQKDIELFEFDPNTASKEDLMKLGLSPRIANTIQNFRAKNGRFYQAEDLKKIYGFRDEDYERLEAFIKIEKEQTYSKNFQQKKNKQVKEKEVVAELFEFNPNEIGIEDFERLGFSTKLSKRIVKYRDKGGHFYKKEDLLKIYGFPEKRFEEIAKYIIIPKEEKSAFTAKSVYAKKIIAENKSNLPSTKININEATLEEWQQLRGIGPGYAKKIVSYRSKLGGFASIHQVAEIYHFPDSVFQKIKPFLIESEVLRKIKINEIGEDELKKHPYFNWKQAKAVYKYRRQHGDFKTLADLKKILGVFKPADWERIEPYLLF